MSKYKKRASGEEPKSKSTAILLRSAYSFAATKTIKKKFMDFSILREHIEPKFHISNHIIEMLAKQQLSHNRLRNLSKIRKKESAKL